MQLCTNICLWGCFNLYYAGYAVIVGVWNKFSPTFSAPFSVGIPQLKLSVIFIEKCGKVNYFYFYTKKKRLNSFYLDCHTMQ